GNILVFCQNSPLDINENKLKEIFQKDRIEVQVDLGGGDKSYYVYTSDLSYDYVKINAEYST
ncbi:MAG: bifunctional ornithine acetyltransferase/N-acetylglutamate synthase, partial [Smithella sp.]